MPRFAPAALGLLLALLAGAARPAAAQESRPEEERWQLTLDGERYLWDVRLVGLEGDSLVVRQADSLVKAPVERLTEIRLIRKTEMSRGEGGAGALSALMGGDDEIYDLSPLEYPERLRTVQQLLLRHPTEQ